MHAGVVEAVLHDPPALVEDLSAQGFAIDFEVRGVGHLAGGRVGAGGLVDRRVTTICSRASGAWAGILVGLQIDRRSVKSGARAEIQRARVAREHEGRPAPETAATAALVAAAGVRGLGSARHARELAALHVDDVHLAATATL